MNPHERPACMIDGVTSGPWGQSYSYDGFGNLTGQTVIAGSAPAYNVTPDGNTVITASNYDVENRFTGTGQVVGGYQYSYAPGNKRIWRGNFDTSTGTTRPPKK